MGLGCLPRQAQLLVVALLPSLFLVLVVEAMDHILGFLLVFILFHTLRKFQIKLLIDSRSLLCS